MKKLLFFVLLSGCATYSNYPDRWWEAGSEAPKSWEILPTAADRDKKEVILSKRNDLGVLSNFAATPFTYRGKTYASVEGFWQMMKYPENAKDERNKVKWPHTRDQVAAMTAFEANKAGHEANELMKKLKIDWITFEGERIEYKTTREGMDRHYQLIYEATKAKVEQNPEVKKTLLATGDLRLLPDHMQEADATKAYRYYDIEMRLRDEERKADMRGKL